MKTTLLRFLTVYTCSVLSLTPLSILLSGCHNAPVETMSPVSNGQISWKAVREPSLVSPNYTFADDRLMLQGSQYESRVMVSYDGSQWTEIHLPNYDGYWRTFGISKHNGSYLLVTGEQSSGLPANGRVWKSEDGIHWRNVFSLTSAAYATISTPLGCFLLAEKGQVFVTEDFRTWRSVTLNLPEFISYGSDYTPNGIFYKNHLYTYTRASSDIIKFDKNKWTRVFDGQGGIQNVAVFKDKFFFVIREMLVSTSNFETFDTLRTVKSQDHLLSTPDVLWLVSHLGLEWTSDLNNWHNPELPQECRSDPEFPIYPLSATYFQSHTYVYAANGFGFRTTDGFQWDVLNCGNFGLLTDILSNNREFLMFERSGHLHSSTTGEKWNIERTWNTTDNTPARLSSVSWDGQYYYGVEGFMSTNNVLVSVDARLWESYLVPGDPIPYTEFELNDIACSEDMIVVVGNLLAYKSKSSPQDAWVNTMIFGDTMHFQDIAEQNGEWVIAGYKSIFDGRGVSQYVDRLIGYSDDGINWTFTSLGTGSLFTGVAASEDQFLAVTANGEMWMSNDGQQWELVRQFYGQGFSVSNVEELADRFMVIGTPDLIVTKRPETEWINHYTGVRGNYTSAAWNGSRFVVIGEYGHVAISN